MGQVQRPRPEIGLISITALNVAGFARSITDLPRHEAHCFDDSRLDNSFSWKDSPTWTPSYHVGPFRMSVRSQVSMFVDDIVGCIFIPFNLG